MINIVYNLADSQFITPAIIDRDLVKVAIGTEGVAPNKPWHTGADWQSFRDRASVLPCGRERCDFQSDYCFHAGPGTFTKASSKAVSDLLNTHLSKAPRKSHVVFVGACPRDPDLFTLRARQILHWAGLFLHDHLVTPEILGLARREALIIDVGKPGFGPATSQDDINTMLCAPPLKGRN